MRMRYVSVWKHTIGSMRHFELINQATTVFEKITEQQHEKLNRLRVEENEHEGPRWEAEQG